MVTQDVLFGKSGREKLLIGAEKVAKAVSATLGAKGRNVIIDGQGNPRVTKDGVTVARSITPKDRVEAMGAAVLLQAANKTVFAAGDGTTTSTILAFSMIKQGFALLNNKKANAHEIRRGMELAVAEVVKEIKPWAEAVEPHDHNRILQVATISANNDSDIGGVVADAIGKVGMYGDVTVEQSRTAQTTVKSVEGMEISGGFLSPLFITDMARAQCVLKDAWVLIYDGEINKVEEIMPLLKAANAAQTSLLIIANNISPQVQSLLITNHHQNTINSCVVALQEHGVQRHEIMHDIACVTGGAVVSKEKGDSLEKLIAKGASVVPQLGTAKKVEVKAGSTTMYDTSGDRKEINARADGLLDRAEEQSGGLAENLRKRAAKMLGGVAIISVGGNSDVEIKEKADRIDDSLSAAKACLEEGFVPGGGNALASTHKKLMELVRNESKWVAKGIEIVANAVLEPWSTQLINAGLPVKKQVEVFWGFDVRTAEEVNLVDAGIIDPLKVVRCAIENAVSVASTFITTESVVYDIPDEDMGIQS